nr:site-specific DNA-methyltransferase [Thalassoroseus pseudoceratinae]
MEPRILLEDSQKSYHAAQRVSDDDIFDNRLIFGDNLLALKALEQEFTGEIKCVFIDPPYNTGSAFSHYDDGVEHSLWLSLMQQRIDLLHRLLAPEGSIWITIDDNESHYLKLLCDEVFGRRNFVANAIWQKKFAPQANAVGLSDSHDHILVYAKDKMQWAWNMLERTAESDARYLNPDDDPRGPWQSDNFTISLMGGQRGAQYAKTGESNNIFTIVTPSGRKVDPPKGRCWGTTESRYKELVADNRIWFGKDGKNVPRIKRFLSEVQSGIVAKTIWLRDEVGDNQEAKREVKQFNSDDVFATPKPERLLHRVISIASNEGDWVLDSFAGSGTTGAVAHKMNRRWIMVELGEHCHSHILPRMQMAIENNESTAVNKMVGWKGGGGFRYYKLAPSLLEEDEFGNWIINKKYNPEMLTEAMCKLEGFVYSPSNEFYWQHGHSTENDFIYITTQTLTREQLQKLSDEVGAKRSLLVCCGAFRVRKLEDFPNLTLKKIPRAVMSKCEWGKDDYSLEIKALPDAPEPEPDEFDEVLDALPKNTRKARKAMDQQKALFAMEDAE